ncbi:unnamed protein product [Closterium sp. Naga37s-1]|nr:unnamed protein product [Closterium sp. Naga37s-1]
MSRDLQSCRFSNQSHRSSRLPVCTDDDVDDDTAFEAWLRGEEEGGRKKGGKTGKTGKSDVKTGKADEKTSDKSGGDKAKERRIGKVKADPSTPARAAGGGKARWCCDGRGEGWGGGGEQKCGEGGEVGGRRSAGKGEGKEGRGSEGEMEGTEGEEEEGKDQEAAKVDADVSNEAAEMDADMSKEAAEGDAEVAAEDDDDVCEMLTSLPAPLPTSFLPPYSPLHLLPSVSFLPRSFPNPTCTYNTFIHGHDWAAVEQFLGVRDVAQRGRGWGRGARVPPHFPLLTPLISQRTHLPPPSLPHPTRSLCIQGHDWAAVQRFLGVSEVAQWGEGGAGDGEGSEGRAGGGTGERGSNGGRRSGDGGRDGDGRDSGGRKSEGRRGEDYLIKWRDKSHIHCTWMAAAKVEAAAKSSPGLGESKGMGAG